MTLISEMPKASMQNDIHHQLSSALVSVSKYHAQLAADSATKIEIYPASFLKRYRIYRLTRFSGHKVDLFYVGFAPGLRAYVLNPYPENYVSMAHEDGVVIETPETASEYVTVYIEVTRSISSLSYLVHSLDEVGFRPNLTVEREEIKAAFSEQYRSVIAGPTATPAANGFAVTAYVVREQTLELHRYNVSTAGEIHDELEVLERNLPLVYGG